MISHQIINVSVHCWRSLEQPCHDEFVVCWKIVLWLHLSHLQACTQLGAICRGMVVECRQRCRPTKYKNRVQSESSSKDSHSRGECVTADEKVRWGVQFA